MEKEKNGRVHRTGTIEKSHLLKQHQPMVRRMALQMIAKLPASVELDDLIQAGMIGLLDASSRYEDNRGAQFETFASQRIRGAMLDELRANDWGSRGCASRRARWRRPSMRSSTGWAARLPKARSPRN